MQGCKLKYLGFASALSIAFALYPLPAAATDYFDLAPEQLLRTKVLSVSRGTGTIADSPSAVYVVTQEDIARSGVTTIPDALRMVPGVNVAQPDANNWAITIRGLNSILANKLLVMIDGRTIYNPLFGGVFWEAHDLVLEDIDRIEVVRGPGGALWGANAVNGVINIVTRHSRDTQRELVSALYGNEERGTLSVRHGGSFGEDGTYRVYTKAFDRDTSRRPGGDKAYDQWSGYRGGFRADWDDSFTLQGDVYHNETDQLRFDFMLVPPFAEVVDQTIKYEGANLLGRWTDPQEDGSRLSVQSYLDWSRRDEPYNFTDDRVTFDLEAQYNFAPIGRHEIIAGSGFRFMSDHEKADNDVSFDSETRSDSLFSAFAQDKIALVPEEWFLTLGAKFEHNEYSGFEVQPSARLQWHPDERQMFWGAISRAVKTPTRVEHDVTATFGTGPGARAALIGNEGFTSEELTAYEIGYRSQVAPAVSVDATAFYNDYTRLATLEVFPFFVVNNGVDPIHLFIPLGFENNMGGKAYGFEAAASWAVDEDLRLSASYSLLRLNLDAVDPGQEGGEDISPAHQASIRASWNISEGWTLDTTAHYVDRLKATEVDDYIRLDFNLGWQATRSFRFNLVGQNLIDDAHREFNGTGDLNAAEIERSIFGKATWEF